MKHRILDSNGKKVSVRMCVACRENKPKKDLIRVVRSKDGVVSIDEKGSMPGRGAYVCATKACIEKSHKIRGLQRGINAEIPKEIY